MERKLVSQGRGAMTITLPAQWIKKKGLRAGESITISERRAGLLVQSGPAAPKQAATVHLRELPRSGAWHLIAAKYIEGYDEIEVFHNNPSLVQEIIGGFIGMIIEEHTPTRTIIRSIVAVPEENFAAVFRRAGHLLVQLSATLELMAQGKATQADIDSVEHLLNAAIMYCMRYLHKYETSERQYQKFLLCSTIEESGDLIKTIARHIGNDVALAKDIHALIADYTQMLFKKEFSKLYTRLRKFRNSLATQRFVEGLAFWLSENLYDYLGYHAAPQ